MKVSNTFSFNKDEIIILIPASEITTLELDTEVNVIAGPQATLPPNNKIIIPKYTNVTTPQGIELQIPLETYINPSTSGDLTVPPNSGTVQVDLSSSMTVTFPESGGTQVEIADGSQIVVYIPELRDIKYYGRVNVNLDHSLTVTVPEGGLQVEVPEGTNVGITLTDLSLDNMTRPSLILPAGTVVKKDIPDFVRTNPLKLIISSQLPKQDFEFSLHDHDSGISKSSNILLFKHNTPCSCKIELNNTYSNVLLNDITVGFNTKDTNKPYKISFPKGLGEVRVNYNALTEKYNIQISGEKASFEPEQIIGPIGPK